ncbi:MAG: RICIN domain-containing protein, partial [Bacteroidales bacterium]|nr:RICIN domain-containing protein [Bacteroidales bacterium]
MKKNYFKLNLLIWAVLTSALLSAQTNINIDFKDNKQTIRNFGASTGMHGGDIGTEWDLATKNEMARYLFDKNTGVGMSSFRLEIGSGTAQQGWYSGIRNKENKSESPLLGALPNGVYKIINKNSGLALDLIDEHSENGAKVKQYSYWGGDNQKWVLTALGGGIYEVTNFKSGKCLEVLGWSTENGAIVQQWDCGGDNKRWQILPTGDGHYMF